MMQCVTPRQLEILRFLRTFRREHGYSPTMQEIGEHIGLTKVTVFEHVAALEKKGIILRGAKHTARSLQVSPEFQFPDEVGHRIPLVGRIAAGTPIEAVEAPEEIDLETIFEGRDEVFALRVSGDSMVEDHIQDGDYVICERRASFRDGEVVVALLPDGDATLKRIYRERGRFCLRPSNANYKPIYARQVNVQGVVVGVLRRMQ